MSQHRFDVGSIVVLQTERGLSRPQGRYFVEAHLPPIGTALQYRVKSESEGFRRVVVEDLMSSPNAKTITTDSHPDWVTSGEED